MQIYEINMTSNSFEEVFEGKTLHNSLAYNTVFITNYRYSSEETCSSYAKVVGLNPAQVICLWFFTELKKKKKKNGA